jgi:hypothetical protein
MENHHQHFETYIQEHLDREDLRELARLNWYRDYRPKITLNHLQLSDDDCVLEVLWAYDALVKSQASC